MIRNYFLLNLLLMLVIGVLGFRLYNVLEYSPEMPVKADKKADRKDVAAAAGRDRVLNEKSFDAISKLDLFNPSRSASSAQEKKTEAPQLKNPPKLFGTIILKENKSAILEDPESKTTKMYRINDLIAGYRLSEIYENKIVLSRNGDTVEVRLRDDKGIKPAKRSTLRTPAKREVKSRTSSARQRRTRPVPPRRRPTRVRPPVTQSQAQ